MSHLSDAELILALDGEVPGSRIAAVEAHLSACAVCRARKASFESTSEAVVTLYEQQPTPVSQLRLHRKQMPLLAAAAAIAIFSFLPFGHRPTYAPSPSITPGAVTAATRAELCAALDEAEVPAIAASAAHAVFEDYGIRNPKPRTYEIDYLIPPDLGGATDRRNLWPQPYAEGTWNSRVKDALEDRLHALVCAGKLDLTTAQQELASDWVAAYRKYFRTAEPLSDHAAFIKDPAWQ
ncbi:anti-sigma factor family protein [Bryobacter aggregatus]|uniref:anti-sigma factor family protein n=1 Tax=Bryobacter aggregatus TaxID=360054 RepID=UPI00068EA044|nr:zf-HC2 domain-containing protein [Bryobacter aggregatus]